MDRRTHIIYPRPHNPILPRCGFIWIELTGSQILQAMNPLRLDLHVMFVLFLWKVSATCGKKIETMSERKFSIRGLKNKVILELGPWSTVWFYFPKGRQPPPIFLLVEGVSIHPKTSDWHLKPKYMPCTEVKEKFQSGVIVYSVYFLIKINQTAHINNWGFSL